MPGLPLRPGRHAALLHAPSVGAVRLATAVHERSDGAALVAHLRRLLEAHAGAGSRTAGRLLAGALPLGEFWLVEPAGAMATAAAAGKAAQSAAGGG